MKNRILLTSLVVFGAAITVSQAAAIITGDVTTALGPNFFFDSAATGGGDYNVNQPGSTPFERSFGTLNVGAGGTTINITGIGWATSNSSTLNDATSATVGITYLGADGVSGGGDDVLIGSATDNFTFAANGEYYWKFDTTMTATIDGLNNVFRIAIAPLNNSGGGSISFKTTLSNPNGNATNAKLSVAGTSVALVPEPSAALLGGLGLLAMLRRRR